MESVASRIHESSQQLARHRNTFFSRTREASAAFFGETRDAGRQLVGAVQTEAKRWRRFATQRADALRNGARAAMNIPTVERTLLTQVDGALKAIDARVRTRIAELEGKPRKARKAGSKSESTRARAKKQKQTLPAIAA
jgi:hypothetical protein